MEPEGLVHPLEDQSHPLLAASFHAEDGSPHSDLKQLNPGFLFLVFLYPHPQPNLVSLETRSLSRISLASPRPRSVVFCPPRNGAGPDGREHTWAQVGVAELWGKRRALTLEPPFLLQGHWCRCQVSWKLAQTQRWALWLITLDGKEELGALH